MSSFGRDEILLTITAVCFLATFHLGQFDRVSKVLGYVACGCALVGVLADYEAIGFAAFLTLAVSAMIVQFLSNRRRQRR